MPANSKRLIVPVNGGDGDARAIAVAGDLTQHQPIAITLIYVVEVQQSMPLDAELPAEIDRGERILDRALDLAKVHIEPKLDRVTTDLLQARSAGAAIVDEAIERHADTIVLATTLRVKLGKTGMGETATYVLKNAPCEVVLVRLASPV